MGCGVRRLPPLRSLTAFIAVCFLGPLASAAPISEDWLQQEVDGILEEYGLIALGAGVLETGGDAVIAVSGNEASGSDVAVTSDAAWHIGSNTKALTALLYARLVERGETDWGVSVAELFSGTVKDIDPHWQDITIEDLFAHRSGAGDIGPVWLIARAGDDSPLPRQRLETARDRLTSTPPGEPGTFEYSNLNYILAGAAIELITGTSWEEAIGSEVFKAEGGDWSSGWGFGPPPSGPVGHDTVFGLKVPAGRGSGADNPPALGPAGTVHVPIDSHLRLLSEFIDRDSTLISDETRTKLLSPWPDEDADYAMGWGVTSHEALGTVYAHRGSNTMWLSHAEMVPGKGTVFIVNTNMFTGKSREAVSDLVRVIETRLAEPAD